MTKFRDVLEVEITAGKGGDGSMSFLRGSHQPKGGPDGGHGGKGGSVFLRAIQGVESLTNIVGKRKFKAENGGYGAGRLMHGADGADFTVDVPVGTVCIDLATNKVIADLLEVGQVQLVARGGSGGRGNSAFSSSTRRSPRFAELGTHGDDLKVRLELRLIADIGLVGYPNAGKSSLLRAMSNANPEVAAYPFTTLNPILGIIERGDDQLNRLTLADIPGIIEGAHEGKGLGLEFLRHISRTRLLAFVLDGNEAPREHLEALRFELQSYDPTLLELPAIIIVNKLDLIDDEIRTMIETELFDFGLPVLCISALEGIGLDTLRETLFQVLPAKMQRASLVVRDTISGPEPVRVTADTDFYADGTRLWNVTGGTFGARIERFSRHLEDAADYLEKLFKREGLNAQLRRAGVKPGDTVKIGEFAFEFFEDEFSDSEHKQV